MSTFSIALTLFLVANPIGNTPVILSLIKNFDFDRQRRILFREALFSLLIAIFFQFFGEIFLNVLQVKNYAVTLGGGLLLFLTALRLIFSQDPGRDVKHREDPFIVPIATPLISGPGVLTMIMLYSKQEENNVKIFVSILFAWLGVMIVLAAAPYLQRVLGKRGLVAVEQLMGMIVAMMSAEMITKGIRLFVKTFE